VRELIARGKGGAPRAVEPKPEPPPHEKIEPKEE
jgi:hypothetical protein